MVNLKELIAINTTNVIIEAQKFWMEKNLIEKKLSIQKLRTFHAIPSFKTIPTQIVIIFKFMYCWYFQSNFLFPVKCTVLNLWIKLKFF